MQYFQNNDLEFLADYHYGMTDSDEDPFSESQSPMKRNCVASLDSDAEDDVELDFSMSKAETDTSALEVRNGKDIQGIPWEKLNYSRDGYRETRLRQYKNYGNFSGSHEGLERECKQVDKGHKFYDFQFNTRLVKPTIFHFQLRNLLWATSKHDVYLTQNYSIMHWSSMLQKGKEILDVAKPVVPPTNCGSLAQELSRVQISTMTVKDNFVVAGGFHGELICKKLDHSGVAFCTKVSRDDNAITNDVNIFNNPSGSMMVMTANNDAQVRVFDAESFTCVKRFPFSWCVNNASASPDGRLLAVLGDSVECVIADAERGAVVGKLKGHFDYGFSSAWDPDGRILATGSQDTTCRLWDIRNLSKSLRVLKGRMGAIRAVKFSSDSCFLAMAEAVDFVHVFDTKSQYVEVQEIDMFGEIAGISFSPDTEALFVGVSHPTYASLLEFIRRRHFDLSIF